MKRLQKWVAVLSAILIGLSSVVPTLAYAQAMPGGDLTPNGGGAYGQALGGRRSQSRPIGNGTNSGQDNGLQDVIMTGMQGQGMQRGMGGMMDANAYQIHILGQVRHPGTYRLPPSTRMAEAIDMAGGIASKGSFRQIELRRNNHVVHTYDLSAFLYGGHLDQNPFLLDNDSVYVPVARKVVSVQGPVNRTGVIELVNENSLTDVVKLAGGYTVGILRTDPATVIRYRNGKKDVVSVPLSDESPNRFVIEDGDMVIFPHQLTKGRKFDYNFAQLPNDTLSYPSFNDNIFIMGAVAQPGAYPFNPFYDVRHYVNMAGPVRYANLKHVKILDMNGKQLKYSEGYRLNPGDTVVVPYKSFTTDNVLKWYNTISSTVFTGFALQQLIKQR